MHLSLRFPLLTLFILLSSFPATLSARPFSVERPESALTLPAWYGDGMVLQRGRPIRIAGRARRDRIVSVTFKNETKRVKVKADGHWAVTFESVPAGGPYRLEVRSEEKSLVFSDVWVGEVWVCSGQSNMEFRLNACATASSDLAAAPRYADRIHLYDMEVIALTDGSVWNDSIRRLVNVRQYYRPASWTRATPEAADHFSAIAYHFGRVLSDSLDCHVGLILNAVGGSATESWIDRETIAKGYPAMISPWEENELVQDWVRGRAVHNNGGLRSDRQSHPYHVSYLFESGIRPLNGLSPAGILWYQGESNAHNVTAHERLFPLLVKSWRNFFENKKLPFYFVQLSSISPRTTWPAFRDSQRRLAEKLPQTFMAVSSDLGDSLDVHPRFKRPVGERLAASALHHTYGYRDVTPSGPAFRSAHASSGALLVRFDYAEGLKAAKGALTGFEIAGKDGRFVPAKAVIEGATVRLTAPGVPSPRAVRYGWKPFTHANLINAAGLPASTFCYPKRR